MNRDDERRLDVGELRRLLQEGLWQQEAQAITRTFTFKGFKGAIAFVNRVAEAANAANHHPEIHLERYRLVRIVLTTHLTGGISDADVHLAHRIDQLEVSS